MDWAIPPHFSVVDMSRYYKKPYTSTRANNIQDDNLSGKYLNIT